MAPIDPKNSNLSQPRIQKSGGPSPLRNSAASSSNVVSLDRFEKNPLTLADGHLSRQVKGLESLSVQAKKGNSSPKPQVTKTPPSGGARKTQVTRTVVRRRRVPGVAQFANGVNSLRQGARNIYDGKLTEGVPQIVSGGADMLDSLPEGVKKTGKVGSKFLKHAGPAAALATGTKDASDAAHAYRRGDMATTIEEGANVAAAVGGCSPAAPAAWTYTLLDAGMEVTGADKKMIQDLDRSFMNKKTNLASQKQDVEHRANARMLLGLKPEERRALRGRNQRQFAQGLQELKRQASRLAPESKERAFRLIELIKKDITVNR